MCRGGRLLRQWPSQHSAQGCHSSGPETRWRVQYKPELYRGHTALRPGGCRRPTASECRLIWKSRILRLRLRLPYLPLPNPRTIHGSILSPCKRFQECARRTVRNLFPCSIRQVHTGCLERALITKRIISMLRVRKCDAWGRYNVPNWRRRGYKAVTPTVCMCRVSHSAHQGLPSA